MSDLTIERLYALLPAIYRLRDHQQGEPLHALLAVIENEFQFLQADLEALYDNWFIETADNWVVPYIADLIGIAGLDDAKSLRVSQRQRVANTIAYRRRKGTLATLEHVAQDATGWNVHAVEYNQLVMTTLNVMSKRRMKHSIDLHEMNVLASINGPFDQNAHTVDVRQIGSPMNAQNRQAGIKPGKYRPDQIGLHVWRLTSYQVESSPARIVQRETANAQSLPAGCYMFHPLGRDTQLFNQPQELDQITALSKPSNLPHMISRADLAIDLAEYALRYGKLAADQTPPANSVYYGPDASLFIVHNGTAIPPSALVSADLSRWRAPHGIEPSSETQVAVDPVLGRLMFINPSANQKEESVQVCFNYGFSADMGGGPYNRYNVLAKPESDTHLINVIKGSAMDTFQKALADWESFCADCAQRNVNPHGIIQFLDNGIYGGNNLVIRMPPNSALVIQADDGVCPSIITVGAIAIESEHASANLILNGLTCNSRIEIRGGLDLSIAHCSLMPAGLGAKLGKGDLKALRVAIDTSIVGPIHLPAEITGLTVTNSIIDHANGYAIAAPKSSAKPGPALTLNQVTIFGKVNARKIETAENVIFSDPISILDQQHGIVRSSYVPEGSQTPRREQCQPDLVLAQSNTSIHPIFTSMRYGDPGYAQVASECPAEILRGSSDGAEMGAFHDRYQTQRLDNLYNSVDEYLPFGLTTGVFFET